MGFTLDNGEARLARYFSLVERREYVDSLRVTDARDLAMYVRSANAAKGLPLEGVANFLETKMRDGSIHITKQSGIFIAKKHCGGML